MTKKRHKKQAIGFGIIISVIIFLVWRFYTPDKYIVERFTRALDAYDYVANFCYDDYGSIEYASSVVYEFISEDNILYCYADSRKIELDDISQKLFREVYENYYLDGQRLNSIVVSKGFVSFSNLNGREAYVYSVDGKVPKTGEINGIRTERMHKFKMVDNWYHVSSCSIRTWIR